MTSMLSLQGKQSRAYTALIVLGLAVLSVLTGCYTKPIKKSALPRSEAIRKVTPIPKQWNVGKPKRRGVLIGAAAGWEETRPEYEILVGIKKNRINYYLRDNSSLYLEGGEEMAPFSPNGRWLVESSAPNGDAVIK
ncbi:hypothetical protein LCGC14_2812090, partial [marine sediment metagenome]